MYFDKENISTSYLQLFHLERKKKTYHILVHCTRIKMWHINIQILDKESLP